MGNCQAIDAAALVIQHPNGKIDRMYWSITANEVMKINPGHYVSIIIPLPCADGDEDDKTVRFTRVKLLRPSDTLVLGRAYRLVTTHEVIRAKKHAKMKKNKAQSLSGDDETSVDNTTNQVEGNERMLRQRSGSILGASRSRSWRPCLQSISELMSEKL